MAESTEYNGKLADPGFRHQRAVKAARARTTVDAHVRAVVARAPELTDEQRSELRRVLSGGA